MNVSCFFLSNRLSEVRNVLHRNGKSGLHSSLLTYHSAEVIPNAISALERSGTVVLQCVLSSSYIALLLQVTSITLFLYFQIILGAFCINELFYYEFNNQLNTNLYLSAQLLFYLNSNIYYIFRLISLHINCRMEGCAELVIDSVQLLQHGRILYQRSSSSIL